MEWLPCQLKHTMWLTTFICSGWEYGFVIVPLSPHLLAQIWEVSLQMMPWHSGWGSKPTWNGPTSTPNIYKVIPNLHMLWMGVWRSLHAITTYYHTCWPRFGKSAEICVACIVHTNDAMVQWLRLLPHMEWLPHPLQIYTKWLTTFICCGWEYGGVIIPLLPNLLAQIWEVKWNCVTCLRTNVAMAQ